MNFIQKPAVARASQTRKFRKTLMKFLFLFLVTFSLSACNVDLYQGLTEKQANTILATLLKNSIEAKKVSQGKKGFSILVDESKLIQALDLLNTQNLPGEDFQSLGSIFKGESMIASPGEENARMAYAISQELSDTFSRMDGVLTSRVHIVLGNVDQVSNIATPPSAAIFIRHLPESIIVNYIAQLRELTTKAIPNLSTDHVSIVLMPIREEISTPRVEPPTFFGVFINMMTDSIFMIFLIFPSAIGATVYLSRLVIDFYKNYKMEDETPSDNSDESSNANSKKSVFKNLLKSKKS